MPELTADFEVSAADLLGIGDAPDLASLAGYKISKATGYEAVFNGEMAL